jgi:hypothetical protein
MSLDLPKEAPALHRLPHTFSTCQMTLVLDLRWFYGGGSNGCMFKVTWIGDKVLLHLHLHL